MNRLERMLKDFDENQLREINKFLNSADGRRLKSHINSTDKDKLLQEFSKLDPNEVKKRNRVSLTTPPTCGAASAFCMV